jgi:enterochelin esterase-like enzyme
MPSWTECLLRRRRLFALAVLPVLLTSASRGQGFTGFDDFFRRHQAAAPDARPELTQLFVKWQQTHGGFPIADPSGRVVFVYFGTGQEQDVRVTGDFRPKNFFNPYWETVGERMTRVGSAFYLEKTFEPDARLDYRFVVDGKGILDPLNARTLVSGTGEGDASELVMPAHRLPSELVAQPNVPKGTLQSLEEAWAMPKVTIYLPPGYDIDREYPALYTTDGSAWIDYIGVPTILDNLIASGAIEPIVAVLIDADVDRTSWYHFNPDYLEYLKRVVSHVDDHYATRARADGRLHAGTSAGGKSTAYVGFELPDVFGKLAMLSSSVSGPLYYFEPYFSGRKRPPSNLRVWLSAGTYEGAILSETETLEAYFKRAGIPTKAVYLHQGHSFGAWREAAVEMLQYFYTPSQ